jgi:hypothetical protein
MNKWGQYGGGYIVSNTTTSVYSNFAFTNVILPPKKTMDRKFFTAKILCSIKRAIASGRRITCDGYRVSRSVRTPNTSVWCLSNDELAYPLSFILEGKVAFRRPDGGYWEEEAAAIARILGVKKEVVQAFNNGFCGSGAPPGSNDVMFAYNFGQECRKNYLG